MTSNDREPPANTQLQASRHLWFGSYHGVLSTHSAALPGFPFGSLVPMCRDHNGLPLLLLSHLAQHTQNLATNPYCSLILIEQGGGDIQQLGRLTCLAEAERFDHIPENLSQRFFRYFPDTRDYYEKLNFQFYRLNPERFYFIGGFGAARWIDPSRVLPTFAFTASEESELLTQVQSHALFAESIDKDHTPVGVDCLGLDLKFKDRFSRVMFAEPSFTSTQYIENLGRLLQA